MSRRVYLDHNASTPVHPDALAAMLPCFREDFGNPSSIHGFGRDARAAIDTARGGIARFLGVPPEEILFTSGGTESDNLALKGLAVARGSGHLITTKIEHHAVLRTCQWLETQGFGVTYIGVDQHGQIDPDDVRRAVRPDTIAISVMHANSEIGTIQPVAAVGAIARERGIPFHVDAVQTFGKLDIDVHRAGIDLLSFSSHKIYGPKGVAGLWVRTGTAIASLQHGGDHERRRRAGTENVAGIVGFGKAVDVRAREMAEERGRLVGLRDRLFDGICARVSDVRLNGHPTERLAGTLSVSYRGVAAEAVVLGLDLDGIAVSAGSACASGSAEPSYVLRATNAPLEWALGAVRHSLGRSTTAEDIDYVIDAIDATVGRSQRSRSAAVA